MAGIGVINMDRQKASLAVMSVEQRQLLMALHRVGGVIDVQHDGPRWLRLTPAPQIHHCVREADQRPKIQRVLQP
jgi:hypothetical protein